MRKEDAHASAETTAAHVPSFSTFVNSQFSKEMEPRELIASLLEKEKSEPWLRVQWVKFVRRASTDCEISSCSRDPSLLREDTFRFVRVTLLDELREETW